VGHDNWVRTLGVSRDGQTLYSGDYDGRWLSWEVAAETPSKIFDCDLHPNGVDLFTAHFDGHVRCLRCSAG